MAFALSFVIHQARSSKASGANSKLLKRFLERDSFLTAHGPEETLFHFRASEKIGGFTFGLDFAPKFDGHDDAHWVAGFVRDVLNLAVSHRFHRSAGFAKPVRKLWFRSVVATLDHISQYQEGYRLH